MKTKIYEGSGVPTSKTPAGRQAPPHAVSVARESNDGAPFYSSSAALYLEKMRGLLNMPPRDAMLWARMTIDQRQAVLVAAGYPAAWSGRQWAALTWREQTRIINQVQAFAAWASKLQVPT